MARKKQSGGGKKRVLRRGAGVVLPAYTDIAARLKAEQGRARVWHDIAAARAAALRRLLLTQENGHTREHAAKGCCLCRWCDAWRHVILAEGDNSIPPLDLRESDDSGPTRCGSFT